MIDSHIDGLKAFLGRYTDFIEQRKLNKDPAGNEFQLIKQQAIEDRQQIQAIEGAKEVNKQKNRYKDILPYDYSRVVLPKEDSIEGSDYINANFIKDGNGNTSYIAAQAPMASTVDDFWRMIWTYDVKLVIMACKEVELGKPRCHRYWPDEGQECWFKDIKVILNGSRDFTKTLTLRDLKLLRNGKEKYVTQMHYTDWPDHGAPETTEPIIQLINLARKKHPDDIPPIVIHCSAGCGRTGAIIAIDYARKLLQLKKASEIDVLSIVMDLRRQRPSMVQAKEQLEFLYDVIRDMVSTELSKYTVPNDLENSNYVNIGFVHKDTFGSRQSLLNKSPSLYKKQCKQDSPFQRSKSLYNTESPIINSDKKNVRSQEDSVQQPNIKNQDILFEQIKRQHNAGQKKEKKPQDGLQKSNESNQQTKLYQVKPQDVSNIQPTTKDPNSETKLLKTTAVIPPNTLLSTAALKMKEAEKSGDICQMLESLDSKNSYGIVKSSKHVSEKSEKPSSSNQPQKFNIPPSKVVLDNNSNGNIVASDNYAQLTRSTPPQLQAGLIIPYSIVEIGKNKVAQSDSISSSSRKSSVEATPPLPERTPESFIIVTPENEKLNVQKNVKKCLHSANVSVVDPYISPQDLLEPEYSTLDENINNSSNPVATESSASASCPPTPKNWFSAFSKMKNITKKSGKPTDTTFLSFDNYGFNALGYPNRLNIKPKGPKTSKPSHWT